MPGLLNRMSAQKALFRCWAPVVHIVDVTVHGAYHIRCQQMPARIQLHANAIYVSKFIIS